MLFAAPAKPEGRSKEPAPKPRENGVGEPAKKKLRRGISSGKTERSPKRRGSNDAPEHDENEALYLYRIGEKVLGIAYYDGKVYPCKVRVDDECCLYSSLFVLFVFFWFLPLLCMMLHTVYHFFFHPAGEKKGGLYRFVHRLYANVALWPLNRFLSGS